MPTVTVGLPLYNGAAFVEHALKALLAQSYRNFVVLISDNGSTDGTWEIAQAWAARDPRIVLHRHESNVGMTRNFRYVLDRAGTEYFMWHAYDDWLAPNYLEELVAVLDADPRCGLACGDVVKFTADGTEKRRVFPDLAGRTRLGRVVTILKRPRAPWIYGLFRAEDLRRAFAVSEEFGYAWTGDYITLLPFILNDRIRGTNATAFHYRTSDSAYRTYRPGGRLARLRFFGRYLRFSLAIFGASSLPPLEKVLCLPVLIRHMARAAR